MVEEVKLQTPSPGHLWWMEQVIKEEFELRSFSWDFLSRLLNRRPMNGPLLTNTALLHAGWANRHHCGDRWKRHMNGQCSLLLWRISLPTDFVHGLHVWESSHPSTNPPPFPTCILKISYNRKHNLKFFRGEMSFSLPLLPIISNTILIWEFSYCIFLMGIEKTKWKYEYFFFGRLLRTSFS